MTNYSVYELIHSIERSYALIFIHPIIHVHDFNASHLYVKRFYQPNKPIVSTHVAPLSARMLHHDRRSRFVFDTTIIGVFHDCFAYTTYVHRIGSYGISYGEFVRVMIF